MRGRSNYGIVEAPILDRVIDLPEGPARVAVVSDTHSRPHRAVLAQLRALNPVAILHGGDIGDLTVLADLETVAPLVAVRGNIDGPGAAPDHIRLTVRAADGADLKILLTHIAVRGPKLRADAARLAERAGAQMVICGHSHVPLIGRDRGLIVFNPGSIGPRRFALPITFGVIDFGESGVRLRHVDCETGSDWAPFQA